MNKNIEGFIVPNHVLLCNAFCYGRVFGQEIHSRLVLYFAMNKTLQSGHKS